MLLHVVNVDSDVGERYTALLAPETSVDTTFSRTGVEQFAREYVASEPSG
jgi:hypothetical protein